MRSNNSEPAPPLDDDASDDENADATTNELLSDVARALGTQPDGDISIEPDTLPDDLTSRADDTDEDLSSLFDNTSRKHLTDGFTGSGDEDGESISQNDGDDLPDLPEHPAGA